MKSGIYKLYWNNCDYFYYGQSQNLNKRIYQHTRYFERGDHCNRKLQRVFEKHGMPLFQIIEYCDLKNLNKREQFYIDKFFGQVFCCNISPNSETSRGIKRSEVTRKKISELAKMRVGEKNPNYGNRGAKNPIFGVKQSKSIKRSIAQLGAKNHRFGKNGFLSHTTKKILEISIGKILTSKDVSLKLNLAVTTVRGRLNGHNTKPLDGYRYL